MLGVWAAERGEVKGAQWQNSNFGLRAHSTRRDRLELRNEARTPASAGVRASFRSSSRVTPRGSPLSKFKFEKAKMGFEKKVTS